jgi:hypothetical protein
MVLRQSGGGGVPEAAGQRADDPPNHREDSVNRLETTDDGLIILDEGKHQRCFLKLCEEEMEGCPHTTLQMGGH